MVYPSHPLGHPGIVGVLRLKEKLKEAAGNSGGERSRASTKATIGPDSPEGRVAVGDQPKANVVVRKGRCRRAEDLRTARRWG